MREEKHYLDETEKLLEKFQKTASFKCFSRPINTSLFYRLTGCVRPLRHSNYRID